MRADRPYQPAGWTARVRRRADDCDAQSAKGSKGQRWRPAAGAWGRCVPRNRPESAERCHFNERRAHTVRAAAVCRPARALPASRTLGRRCAIWFESAALVVPRTLPRAAWNARLRVCAASRTPEGRCSRSEPGGSLWCCRRPVPRSLISAPLHTQARSMRSAWWQAPRHQAASVALRRRSDPRRWWMMTRARSGWHRPNSGACGCAG